MSALAWVAQAMGWAVLACMMACALCLAVVELCRAWREYRRGQEVADLAAHLANEGRLILATEQERAA